MQVGPHHFDIELPDILHIHLHGDVEPEHFQVFFDSIASIPPPARVYVLRDARRGGVVSVRTRRHIAQHGNMGRVAATVTYGASFHSRTVMSMLTKGMRLTNQRMPMAFFFETETEARAWIAEHRTQPRSP